MTQALQHNNFDGLRLAFALSVLFFHLGILSQSSQLAWLAEHLSATFGVQGFFFISGFLVTQSYENTASLKRYLEKRARRIFPAYVAVVALAALGGCLLSTLALRDYFASADFWRYLAHNLMLSNFAAPTLPGVFVDNPRHAVNGSLWTIKVEVLFYLMVPVLVWLGRRYGALKTMLAAALLSLAWKIGLQTLGEWADKPVLVKLSLQAPGQLSYFLGGMLALQRTQLGLAAPRWWQAATGVATYALTDGILADLLDPIAVYLIVYWLAISVRKFGHWARYGDFSYGIYLFHWPTIQVFVWLGLFKTAPFGATVLLVLTVLVLAVLSWLLVERRFLPAARRAG